jgi:hypothetical protein
MKQGMTYPGFIINRRFGGMCRLLLQGMRARIFFCPEDGDNVPPKRRVIINPHGATSQKTAFFIVTAVKTSLT